MDWKSFFYGMLTVSIFLLALASFGIAHLGNINSNGNVNVNGNVIQNSFDSDGIPQECRTPAGQDTASWKEHLGHHTETKDCLKYFN